MLLLSTGTYLNGLISNMLASQKQPFFPKHACVFPWTPNGGDGLVMVSQVCAELP